MDNKNKRNIIKYLGIMIAVVGVIAYRYMPDGWHIFMWIPITIGYGLYYNE